MLDVILQYLHNYFITSVRVGKFDVEGGSISLSSLRDGQYFYIHDSVFNDGLHLYPAYDLVDEVFEGTVWELSIPQSIIALATEIEGWQKENAAAVESPYQSESFGGYTYTKATAENGKPMTWQKVFADRLAPYRKPREYGFMEAAT